LGVFLKTYSFLPLRDNLLYVLQHLINALFSFARHPERCKMLQVFEEMIMCVGVDGVYFV
jgi:hypothetical protein